MLRLPHVEMYLSTKQLLISTAIEVAKKGKNHRDFLVGCAVLAYNGKEYRIFTGANYMPVKGGRKFCAEQRALRRAIRQGFPFIIAVVVAGQPQVDGESGISSSTLPPCGNCRRLLRALPGVSDDTIIFTVTRDGMVAEQQFVRHLLRKYHK